MKLEIKCWANTIMDPFDLGLKCKNESCIVHLHKRDYSNQCWISINYCTTRIYSAYHHRFSPIAVIIKSLQKWWRIEKYISFCIGLIVYMYYKNNDCRHFIKTRNEVVFRSARMLVHVLKKPILCLNLIRIWILFYGLKSHKDTVTQH